MADHSSGPTSDTSPSPSWKPHLWVFVAPVVGVIIAYALWFLLMAVLSLPDWLVHILR
jgi:hypothetical protein